MEATQMTAAQAERVLDDKKKREAREEEAARVAAQQRRAQKEKADRELRDKEVARVRDVVALAWSAARDALSVLTPDERSRVAVAATSRHMDANLPSTVHEQIDKVIASEHQRIAKLQR